MRIPLSRNISKGYFDGYITLAVGRDAAFERPLASSMTLVIGCRKIAAAGAAWNSPVLTGTFGWLRIDCPYAISLDVAKRGHYCPICKVAC